MPETASLARSGAITMWGASEVGHTAVPAELTGVAVSQVVVSTNASLGLTAAGKVVGWGGNMNRLQRVPEAVNAQPIAQVAINHGSYAGAVTRDGRVLTWGAKSPHSSPLNVPASLTGVKQLVISNANAVALKGDGTAVAWGRDTTGINTPPVGLKATALAANVDTMYALTPQGTVVAWGSDIDEALSLPAAVQQPGNVKAIAAIQGDAIALLADNTLVGWGRTYTRNPLPGWLQALSPVAITGAVSYFGMMDDQGVIHQWNPSDNGAEVTGVIPSAVTGQAISYLDAGGLSPSGAVIITKMLRADSPRIAGVARAGSTLTATPGTFSASPTSVTGQWLANNAPIAGATGTRLALTQSLVGKAISYRSTASKAGETTIASTSTAVRVAAPPVVKPVPVASNVKVTKVKVAKKGKTLTVTGKVSASKAVAGTAVVELKKGKKVVLTTQVKVSASGVFKVTVKKFAGKVAKKMKAKGKKAKTAYRGKYMVTVRYAGNSAVKAGTGAKGFKAR